MNRTDITEKQDEVLSISQEECAEVIQAISKIKRFGLISTHNGETNQEHLEEEVGDLTCMLELLEEFGLVNYENVRIHANNKRKKLQRWTNIFKD
jgi:NTP pyrophosphatase (non-canonical NTP hydrolase)